MESNKLIKIAIHDHINMFSRINKNCINAIERAGELISKTFISNKALYICGNGGSAADCQHLASEFVGRFKKNRMALNAISLSTDTSIITSIANDYDFEDIFSRQLEAVGSKNDCLICISTSGNSANTIKAIKFAKNIGINTISLTGQKGGLLSKEALISIKIPSNETAIIQEGHLFVEHMLCHLVEQNLGFNKNENS